MLSNLSDASVTKDDSGRVIDRSFKGLSAASNTEPGDQRTAYHAAPSAHNGTAGGAEGTESEGVSPALLKAREVAKARITEQTTEHTNRNGGANKTGDDGKSEQSKTCSIQ